MTYAELLEVNEAMNELNEIKNKAIKEQKEKAASERKHKTMNKKSLRRR